MLTETEVQSFMYTQYSIEMDDATKSQLQAIGDWMEQASMTPAELYARETLSGKYSRNEVIDYNLSAIVDGCVRKLLYDIEEGIVDVEALQELSQTYHARARGVVYLKISVDEIVLNELNKLFVHFGRLKVLIKPISKRNVNNLKSPLNIALLYAYEYVKKQTAG